MLVLAPYARYVPRAALAGILMLVSWNMVDRHLLRFHWKASAFDAVIVAATALSAVAISVEFCVLIGVLLSFMLAVPRAGRMLLTEFVVGEDGVIHERMEGEAVCPRIRIYGLEGELFFGASSALDAHLDRMELGTPEAQVIVLRVKRVRSPDAVCLHQLDEFVSRQKARGVQVLWCGVRPDLLDGMQRTGLQATLGEHAVFVEQPVRHSATAQAVRHAYTLLRDHCEGCSHLAWRGEGDRPIHYAIR
jgi:SulP family sulfate permease